MRRTKTHGLTLVEVMITLAIAVVLGGAIMSFYLASLRAGYGTQRQIGLQTTLRGLSAELIHEASRAHELVLFSSAASADRDAATDRRRITADEDGIDLHPTGDFAVFIFYETPRPAAQARYRIARLVGYYAEAIANQPSQLVRFEIDFRGSPSTQTVEQALAAYWNGGTDDIAVTRSILAPSILPLALSDHASLNGGQPQLFYLTSVHNVAVCGQLFDSASGSDTKSALTYTRTFFFTLSVRT